MSHRYYVTELGRVPTGAATEVTASDGDVIMLRYEWPGTLGGRDADTFTGIEPGTGTPYDGEKRASTVVNYLGYAGNGNNGASTGYPMYHGTSSDPNNAGCLMYFAGDNTQTAGQEVVLIRPKKIADASPGINVFKIGIYLNWYSQIGIGCMNFKMRVYNGGTFASTGPSGYDITNSGGTLLRTYTFNANTNNQNNPNGTHVGFPSNGINGYSQIGIFTFGATGNGVFRYNLTAVGNC
jgi:hypothetical protein